MLATSMPQSCRHGFLPGALFRCRIVMDAELLTNIKQQIGISHAVFGGSEQYPSNCAEPAHQSQANLLIDFNTKTILTQFFSQMK